MSVIQSYCPTCRRTVYAEGAASPECPVCLTPVFVPTEKNSEKTSEKSSERPATPKNGSPAKS